MASRMFTAEEARRQVLEALSDEELSDFSDESEQDISEIDSGDSSGEEMVHENEISDNPTNLAVETYDNDPPNEDRDRSPVRPQRDIVGRGRGRGRARGRGRGGQRVARPQDPELDWHQHYVPPQSDRSFKEPSPGPRQRYPAGSKERDYFYSVFTDELWNIMVQETNLYHDQKVASEPNKHKRKWNEVTKDEMEAFVGILIYMGIVKLPRMNMYWSKNRLLHQESVSKVMSQTRFMQIWRYFHLADNANAVDRGQPGHDKIYRTRKFLDIILRNSQRLYSLDKDISIDETMVPHKGRLSYKQYIKNKPIRWGIKLWVLSEAKTGYIYNFQVNLGKEGNNTEHNLARRVVKHLVGPTENLYHHLYMDNFYCDPHLFLELEQKQILACGTIRANRKGFPKDIVLTSAIEKTMNRGDYVWRCHNSLVAMAWYDKRTVYLISTIHPPVSTGDPTTVQRRSAGGNREPIRCPPAQADYQDFMGGVDLSDQMQQCFSVIRKSNKAWKKLFYYGLEVCLLNSFIIMKKSIEYPGDFLAYRLAIVNSVLEGKCFRSHPGRPRVQQDGINAVRLNRQYHQIAVEENRRDCVVCSKVVVQEKLNRNLRYKTNTVCVTCDRSPLCVHSKQNCWEKWHSVVEYWR